MGSVRKNVVMSVAAVTLATGAVVAITSGSMAHAATADCGNGCVESYTLEYGAGNIVAVDAGATEPGLGVGLGVAGAYSTEDFTIIKEGLVSGLYQKGIVGNVVDEQWGSDLAYQYDYAPDGVLSGFCLGLANAPSTGEGATLEPCGVNADTIWISMFEDENDAGYFPWINASDTVVGTPCVLTAVRPRIWLRGADIYLEADPLSVVSGTVDPAQMWGEEFGIVGG
jgi:hypothetical protein